LIDTQFVLNILSHDRKAAIDEFKGLSDGADGSQYLDIPEEKKVQTIEEGQAYLKKYLQEHWSGHTLEDVLTTKRQEIIADLRANTHLSVRTIAQLLGLNRNVVERVRVK